LENILMIVNMVHDIRADCGCPWRPSKSWNSLGQSSCAKSDCCRTPRLIFVSVIFSRIRCFVVWILAQRLHIVCFKISELLSAELD
jgi:hypothetical protein